MIKRLDARAERGFSMFIAIMAMAVTAMFIAAAFAAANGDLPVSGQSKDRKVAYAAAEAGLNFYLNHLQQDPDYWTLCDKAPAPNATEPSPINLQWDGDGADPRVWRNIPDSKSQYTIELLRTKDYPLGCDKTDQKSIIDEKSGTFKLRFTGRPYDKASLKRSIVATFRRDSFLNFVYFTEYETGDPAASASSTTRANIQAKCADKVRSLREAAGCPASNEISFPNGDKVNGPMHTNDESIFVCGTVTFGRATNPKTDTAEIRGPAPGYESSGSGSCTTPNPIINTPPPGKFNTNANYVPIPQSNDKIADAAKNNGIYYTGKTIIHLKGTSMDVTNYAGGTADTKYDVSLPANGVLYVDHDGSCTPEVPVVATYGESSACGNVYVSGTYSKSLTIAARNDIIIRPTLGAVLNSSSADANLTAGSGSDATLGLIAENFVRVGHKVDRSTSSCNVAPVLTNVTIEAAILSVKHSFTVDNWDCGKLGTLYVKGAIAQKYRGVVATFNWSGIFSGYSKDYWYDDRLRYRSPPYFLDPVQSAWDVVRVHEQVPAR
jgi:hypothetical protein